MSQKRNCEDVDGIIKHGNYCINCGHLWIKHNGAGCNYVAPGTPVDECGYPSAYCYCAERNIITKTTTIEQYTKPVLDSNWP